MHGNQRLITEGNPPKKLTRLLAPQRWQFHWHDIQSRVTGCAVKQSHEITRYPTGYPKHTTNYPTSDTPDEWSHRLCMGVNGDSLKAVTR